MILAALVSLAAGVGLLVGADFVFESAIRIPLGLFVLALALVNLWVVLAQELVGLIFMPVFVGAGGAGLLIGDRSPFGEEDFDLGVGMILIFNGLFLGWYGVRRAMRRAPR